MIPQPGTTADIGRAAAGLLVGIASILVTMHSQTAPAAEPLTPRPRLLVLTDIGGDPDDQQSLIRLLLYANELELEGLIATASTLPDQNPPPAPRTDLIEQLLDAYAQVWPRLQVHAPTYPPPDQLRRIVSAGNPRRGVAEVGPDHDTAGSRAIIHAGDRDDPRPLNIAIWGGQTDLAQALWRVRQERGAAGLATFVRRLRVYDINDQDRIGDWLYQEFPGLFYVLANAERGRDKREGAYRGMYLGGDESLTSRQWVERHVTHDHGPLGALYPTSTWTAPNPHATLKEGDTPSWFYFLPLGLSDPEHPEWGGWGGRFRRGPRGRYQDARDTVGQITDARATVWRWRADYQADFQARLDWCSATRFADANHAPRAVVDDDRSRQIIMRSPRPGEQVTFSAAGSSDPDADQQLKFRWWVYEEPSHGATVALTGSDSAQLSVVMPAADVTQELHLVLEVRDTGTPSLVSYRRMVLRSEP